MGDDEHVVSTVKQTINVVNDLNLQDEKRKIKYCETKHVQ